MPCIHCLVSGRVQGVFYRASTQQQAMRLKLSGWVKNRNDGKVELIACGDVSALQEFETWCWQGPSHAIVSQVSCEKHECDADEFTNGFTVSV